MMDLFLAHNSSPTDIGNTNMFTVVTSVPELAFQLPLVDVLRLYGRSNQTKLALTLQVRNRRSSPILRAELISGDIPNCCSII